MGQTVQPAIDDTCIEILKRAQSHMAEFIKHIEPVIRVTRESEELLGEGFQEKMGGLHKRFE
jgi:hypothetical protein